MGQGLAKGVLEAVTSGIEFQKTQELTCRCQHDWRRRSPVPASKQVAELSSVRPKRCGRSIRLPVALRGRRTRQTPDVGIGGKPSQLVVAIGQTRYWSVLAI